MLIFFLIREKSGNFEVSQGNSESQGKVRDYVIGNGNSDSQGKSGKL